MRNEELGMTPDAENQTEKAVQLKSVRFAVRIVKLSRYLREEKREYELSKQILKSGTSIGANIAEAEYAISRKEFLSKNYIAFKECAETLYWLHLLKETEFINGEMYQSLYADCEELRKLLSSITKTIRET